MRLALACDYDGTLATDGVVDESTIAALQRFSNAGKKLILVTGRQLDDLLNVFPQVVLFDWVVAENGALLYHPQTRVSTALADPPPQRFVQQLQERGVDPVSKGQVIVATWHPHETTVLEVIRELGLAYQVILNKGAVMILPDGINKATGLQKALELLEIAPENTVSVGDAENDRAMLSLCGYGVAVNNALPELKAMADWVTTGDRGSGVVELIDRLLEKDSPA
ncbi:HAD family hydrolase [Geitlerinema splendidum]|nr:HAD family hydrolase [Geitlerinema splendidum]